MTQWQLKASGFSKRPGPLVIVVLDGVGIGAKDAGDAVFHAHTPVLDALWANSLTTQLAAHGTAVGMPSDADMGNSEVGHNALGAGRVFDQGAKLVENAVNDGSLFEGATWRELIDGCKDSATLHLIGLLSDGNVHSHIDHVVAMVKQASAQGVRRLRLHILLDGRDVPAQSALSYVDTVEQVLEEISSDQRDYRIASGGGRMLVTMDRYEADWAMVERGWKTHVLGKAEQFSSAKAAIEHFRSQDSDVSDQYLGAFVVADNGKPVGTIEDGDSVIFFNFRGDRAIEITRAFTQPTFDFFERERQPQVKFAGMMQYDGDLKIPEKFLVEPPGIERTFGEYLARNGLRQFACSETQKFGHVTYFWNGNRSGQFDPELETYLEVPSDNVTFDQRPWMKAAEITDATISALEQGYDLLRINYANGDMVGHTGDLSAVLAAVHAVDLCLGRLFSAIDAAGGIALVLADHGNADEMYQLDKSGRPKLDAAGQPQFRTSHSLNPVPCSIYDPAYQGSYRWDPAVASPGLANVAATALWLMGFEAPEDYAPSLVIPS